MRDPHMDLPPVLIALGATVAVVGPAGERTIPVEELFTGYYETALAKNELITELRIPAQAAPALSTSKSRRGSATTGRRSASRSRLHAEGDNASSRPASSSAQQPTKATRLTAAEEALIGRRLRRQQLLKTVADAAAEEADIIADLRGSASYKRELLRVYVGRAVRAAMQTSGAPH